MKNKRYETLSHTADVMVRAFGTTMEECFENAAYALFDQLADLSKVKLVQQFSFEIEYSDPEQTLVDLLSEMLFLFDTELVLLCDFKIKTVGEMMQVAARGEKIDKKRHVMRKAIKAVSYHAIEIAPEKGYVQVLFDA